MTEKMTAIVLDITRHNDKVNIVTLYSRSRGRLSYLSPVGSGKNGKMRQARLQPLAVIEGDFNFRPVAELQRLGQFSMHTVWHDIYFHPIKRMVALFISEFLNKLLRASMPDENLWDFIYSSLALLDNMEKGIADFHIIFLLSLLPFVGVQPDTANYEPGDIFDMQSGTFSSAYPHLYQRENNSSYILKNKEAEFVAISHRLNFQNIRRLHLTRDERIKIIRGILKYYSVHFPGTGSLKSLDVMHEIFS